MSELREQFLQDGVSFTENLGALVASWDNRRPEEGQLDRAFRLAHSLKSEADYLAVEGVGETAHAIESILQDIRDGNRPWTEDIPADLATMVETLSSYFALQEQPSVRPVAPTSSQGPSPSMVFSDLERALLREAYSRGERAYRALVTIDPESPMKYARAYLVVNNLELSVNVVKVEPPMDGEESRSYDQVDICYTTTRSEDDVRQEFEVDEVKSVSVSELSFRDHLSVPAAKQLALRDVEIPGFRLKSDQVEELRAIVEGIHNSVATLADAPPALVDSSDRLNGFLNDLVTVKTGDLSATYAQYARETARKAGRQVNVAVDVDPLALPRETVSVLNKVVGQLVRNAIVHGLEDDEERRLSGKPDRGNLVVEIRDSDGTVVGSVSDDGRGVPGESVRRRAKELGISPIQKLIDILATPGFTTKDDVDRSAGRGVGLDVVKRTLDNVGGDFDLFQTPGEGCRFTFTLPTR